MMTAPAMRLKIACRSARNWPIALAAAPSATKTIEKPMMNASDAMTTWRRAPTGWATATVPPPATIAVPRISSSERPEMYERYPGTSGRTHGEMNDRRPAPNAASSETFSSMPPTTPPIRCLFHLLERDERRLRRDAFHLDVVPLHGRQVLIHEIPLPPLGRIRRLKPVARRHRPRKDELVGIGVRGSWPCRRDGAAYVVRTVVRKRQAKRASDVDEDLPIIQRLSRRRNHARRRLHVPRLVGVDRILFHVCSAGQHEIGRLCERGKHGPLNDQQRQRSIPPGRDEPGHVAE